MRKILYLFILSLFIQSASFGQNTKINFTEFDLPNGLHVILSKDNTTPIVAVSVMYHVGSKNEDSTRTGFAHFFEHLLFEGSDNIGRGEYFKTIQSAGGDLNANTSQDRTYYYQVLPSNQLELGLYMESERMLHAKIDSIGIETQRQVVKEERRQRYDNTPYGSVIEETMKRAYTIHPYRWTPIGSMKHLNEAKDQEFMDFYKTFYVPNNAVLSIAGDIDIENTKKLVEKYFGEIPRGKAEIPRPTVREPKQTKEVRDTVYDKVQLPAVIQAYHIPEQGTDDYYAMTLLAQLLSQGQSSRMYKSLVDQQQKALATGIFTFPTEDPGITLSYAIANMGVSPQELEAAMEKEYDKVKNELVSEREFQKLKNQIETNFVNKASTVAGRAEALANYYMYFGNTNLINTEIERYLKVSREVLKEVANKYLKKENRVVLYYLPEASKPKTAGEKVPEEKK